MSSLREHLPEFGLLLLAVVLLLTSLGSNSIHNADEARYAIVVDELIERGSFDDFTLRGDLYFNKAPLRIQMTHVLARVFGLSEWTLRLPSAFMGIACIGFVMLLGRTFFGVVAGRWAALVLLTCTQFLYIHGARSGEMDSTLVAFWLAALLAAVRAKHDPRALWWCAVIVGLSGLVKHVAYVVPVGGTVLLWFVMSGDWRVVGWRQLVSAALVALIVPLPWHAWKVIQHGSVFIDGYLGREVVERVAADYQGGYGWAFYLSVIKDGMFPWSLVLPFAFFVGLRSSGPSRFLAVLSLLMVGGLVATQGDLSWYVMPALPMLALLVAKWLAMECDQKPIWIVWAFVAVGLALSPSNVLQWDVHEHFAIEGMIRGDLLGVLQGVAPWWPQIVVAGVMLLGAGLALRFDLVRGRRLTLGAIAAFALLQAALPLRSASQRSDVDLFASELALRGVDDGVVADLPGTFSKNSVLWFYLERAAGDVTIVDGPEQRDPSRWFVVPRAALDVVPDDAILSRDWAALPPVTH